MVDLVFLEDNAAHQEIVPYLTRAYNFNPCGVLGGVRDEEAREYYSDFFNGLVSKKTCILFHELYSEYLGQLDNPYIIANDVTHKHMSKGATFLCDNLELSKKLPNSQVLPYFSCEEVVQKKHLWRYDEDMEVRILIAGDGHKTMPYQKILDGAKRSFNKFRLFVENGVHIKLHQHQLTNDDILNCVDDPGSFSFPPKGCEYDIVVARDLLRVHEALCKDTPVVSNPTNLARSLSSAYNCIELARGWNLEEAFKRLKSDRFEHLVKGMSDYRYMRSLGKVSSRLEAVFGKHELPPPSAVKRPVNVFMAVRNNEDSLGKTLSTLKAAERRSGVEFRYYIYENDSFDDTPNLLRDFYTHSNGNYVCEKLDKPHWSSTPNPRRMLDLAMYRNSMKSLCDNWDSDYSVILDSQIDFSPDIIEKQINLLESTGAVMATPFGSPVNSSRYYDLYAYRDMEGFQEIPDTEEPFEAASAFCGFVTLRSDVFKKCYWDCNGAESEHVSFCQMVRQYGKILVDPNVRVKWKK